MQPEVARKLPFPSKVAIKEKMEDALSLVLYPLASELAAVWSDRVWLLMFFCSDYSFETKDPQPEEDVGPVSYFLEHCKLD